MRTICLCRVAVYVLLGSAGLAAQAVRVKLGTVLPKGTSYHQILLELREKWRQAPGGGAELTIYEGGVHGDEADIVRRIRIGQLQAAVLSVVGLSEIDRSVTALQYMPMMFRSLDEVQYVREKLSPQLEAKLRDKGFLVLFWGDAGWVRFFSKEAVAYPADFNRLKIFVWSGDNHQVDIMKALGYQPVPLVTNDILTGLQTGLISAVPLTPFFALAGQVYGPAPHMLELNWAPLVGATVISRKAWDAIPAAMRDALVKAAQEAGRQMQVRGRAEGEQSVEAMKKRGLKVHPVTPAIEAEWRKVAEQVYPQIRGVMVPAEMFDETRRLLAEYRARK